MSPYMKENMTHMESGLVTKPVTSVEGKVFFPISISHLDDIVLQRQRPNKANSKL